MLKVVQTQQGGQLDAAEVPAGSLLDEQMLQPIRAHLATMLGDLVQQFFRSSPDSMPNISWPACRSGSSRQTAARDGQSAPPYAVTTGQDLPYEPQPPWRFSCSTQHRILAPVAPAQQKRPLPTPSTPKITI